MFVYYDAAPTYSRRVHHAHGSINKHYLSSSPSSSSSFILLLLLYVYP